MADEFKIDDVDRARAHAELDRWLDESARAGDEAFAFGHAGYVGRIKLCAFVDDDGIRLRIERSIACDL